MNVNDVKIDKKSVQIFSNFADSEGEDRKYWISKTPAERLEALELMRQSAYGYENAATRRLQNILEIVKGE